MAGVKITDLGTLTTAVDADLLYIVDVSDTSQSPQGTSKQIEVGNLLDFESGSYTPTFSAEVDCTMTAIKGYYIRVGNIVTCNVNVNAQGPGVFPSTYEFEMTPPIATDFGFGTDAIGLVTETTFLMNGILLYAISATNNIRVGFSLSSSSAFNIIMSIQFQYEVLS
jgi:hypothetical protein